MIDLQLALHKHRFEENDARIKEQEKRYAYYSGDKVKILSYLKKVLCITYDENDVAEMQLQWVNITRKLIDQMAVIYREPAYRYVTDKEGKEKDDFTEYYNKLIPENVNTKDKRAHRLAKLDNTSLTFVGFNKKTGKIDYVVEPSWKYTVWVNDEDSSQVDMIMYDKYFVNPKGEPELYTVVWTPKEHFKLDANGNKSAFSTNEKMINPYGIVPYVPLRLEEGEDFWGDGQSDTVNVNEQINFLLTKVVNSDIILGTEGTILAINLGLEKRSSGGDIQRKEVRVGRKHPYQVDNVTDDKVSPRLEHVSFDPHIEEIRDYIDWQIKQIAAIKGLNPNQILSETKDTSDYQKLMDALDQMELRKDDLEPCREYEKRRFDITRKVNNYFADTEEGRKFKLKEIPEDLELQVDFAEVEIIKTVSDKWTEREKQLQYNMTSPLDWLMEDNPDLTEDEAQEILNENKRINSENGRQMTALEQRLKQLNNNQGGNPTSNLGEDL